jgi:hypothetical protein
MSKGFGTPASVPPSATIKKLKRSLIEQFESLADPRVRQPEHLLLDIVAIAILAVIAGADDMVAVETYGKAKAAWLKTLSLESVSIGAVEVTLASETRGCPTSQKQLLSLLE